MQNTSPIPIFSPKRLNAVQARAARIGKADSFFLAKIAAGSIAERLAVTQREFTNAADIFSPANFMTTELEKLQNVGEVKKIGFSAEQSCLNLEAPPQTFANPEILPLVANSLSLVTSLFGLHWSNDIPGTFIQIRKALKSDGLFMAALPGSQTLTELRSCLIEAESRLTGGVSLRVDQFGEVRQFGNLLQRAGFALPVADTEIFTVRYTGLKSLIADLRAMGASNTSVDYSFRPARGLFELAEEIYHERFADLDGKIRATFEIVYLTGWVPHASQQKPQKPGSAKNQLKDFI
ncbi:MAG: SAM-dependent methyltransferase [Pseudomonadota bacterium]